MSQPFPQELETCFKAIDQISVFTVIQPFSLIMPEKYLRSGSFLNIGAFVSSLNGFQGNRHGYYCIFWNLMWSWVFMNLDKTYLCLILSQNIYISLDSSEKAFLKINKRCFSINSSRIDWQIWLYSL